MPAQLQVPWLRTLARLGLLLAAALAAGMAVGHVGAALAVAGWLVAGWHYRNLRRVSRRLAARLRAPEPSGRDAWSALDVLLHRRRDEWRRRERRLLEMLRAYRAMASALPDAVVLVERNSQRVLWFNEAATPLLGLHHPRDHGMPVAAALKPLPIAQWLAGGRHAGTMEDVPSPADPGVRLDVRLLPYSDEVWLLLARDVSQLVRLQHVRRDFVANASHELRTPLTVIHGYLEMLDADGHPEWAPLFDELRKQSLRMTQLVDDLLSLSRLDASASLPDEHVAMAPLLDVLQHEAEALSSGRHLVHVEDTAGCDLRGAGRELHSAFSNLMGNAVRYTPDGGRISLRLERDGTGVALRVQDTGTGIAARHLPRLTERFYRVSGSRSRASGGTGLGLAIVKHVLELHDAQLHIESAPGRGSTFSCLFPAARVLAREPAAGAWSH